MVTRHGYLPNDTPQTSLAADANPPYPVTPTTGNEEPHPLPSSSIAAKTTDTSDVNLLDDEELPDWDSSDDEDSSKPSALPSALRVGADPSSSQENIKREEGLPSALRIGNPSPLNITKTGDSNKSNGELYQNVWANSTGPTTADQMSPTSPIRKNTNPFLKNRSPPRTQTFPVESSPWDNELNSEKPFQLPIRTTKQEAAISQETASGSMTSPFSSQPPLIPYDTEFSSNQSQNQPPVPEVTITSPSTGASSQPFFSKYGSIKSSNPFSGDSEAPHVPAVPVNTLHQTAANNDPVNPVTTQNTSNTNSHTPPPFASIPSPSSQPTATSAVDTPPPHPPRPSQDLPPPKPPRPHEQQVPIETTPIAGPHNQAEFVKPQEQVKKQRNETYQIKHIRWRDISCHENPRQSPILIQNANGPCPLLALVNALILSTPADLNTALVETLRSREQVSLGLLLDAVFDELMSGRRGGTAQALPDVGELYSFLITLHTGMNVNPRFVPAKQEIPNLIDFDEGVPASVLPPSKIMGSFERTKELQLYGTFAIPLIHGWLPEKNTSAYEAFKNSAPTYEEAQNILFRQEEIEQKLGSQELSHEEERMLIDIDSINSFFTTWPTQLTKHGLEAIQSSLGEGDIAILFRNDHFSTVYKEPRSGALMTLVTDAGYSTHDEIVWESLVDINGTSTEFFAGDFKSVSHEGNDRNQGNRESEPEPGVGRRGTFDNFDVTAFQDPTAEHQQQQPGHARTASEQEDHDLALALQLQEEEEERERNARAAARRREEDLSQQFLSQEARPEIPPRRSNQNTGQRTNRPNSGGPNAPPPYEQAAQGQPFYPPRNHPSSEHAPRRQGLYSQAAAYGGNANAAGSNATGGRRRTARQSLVDQIPSASNAQRPQRADTYDENRERDKCAVM